MPLSQTLVNPTNKLISIGLPVKIIAADDPIAPKKLAYGGAFGFRLRSIIKYLNSLNSRKKLSQAKNTKQTKDHVTLCKHVIGRKCLPFTSFAIGRDQDKKTSSK